MNTWVMYIGNRIYFPGGYTEGEFSVHYYQGE